MVPPSPCVTLLLQNHHARIHPIRVQDQGWDLEHQHKVMMHFPPSLCNPPQAQQEGDGQTRTHEGRKPCTIPPNPGPRSHFAASRLLSP